MIEKVSTTVFMLPFEVVGADDGRVYLSKPKGKIEIVIPKKEWAVIKDIWYEGKGDKHNFKDENKQKITIKKVEIRHKPALEVYINKDLVGLLFDSSMKRIRGIR
jgi:hypothetical protein